MVDRMGSGAHCIALHGMIDEAQKTLQRAHDVSIDLDTQRVPRRIAIQSSASANTRLHDMIGAWITACRRALQ